jgi:hypothetical protein
MNLKDLTGKTIKDIKQKKLVGHDDEGFLLVTFEDGTSVLIVSLYDSYTGNSFGEYPTSITLEDPSDFKFDLGELIEDIQS